MRFATRFRSEIVGIGETIVSQNFMKLLTSKCYCYLRVTILSFIIILKASHRSHVFLITRIHLSLECLIHLLSCYDIKPGIQNKSGLIPILDKAILKIRILRIRWNKSPPRPYSFTLLIAKRFYSPVSLICILIRHRKKMGERSVSLFARWNLVRAADTRAEEVDSTPRRSKLLDVYTYISCVPSWRVTRYRLRERLRVPLYTYSTSHENASVVGMLPRNENEEKIWRIQTSNVFNRNTTNDFSSLVKNSKKQTAV